MVESLSLLTSDHDLMIYDLATGSPRAVFTGGRILRNAQGRTRQFLADGTLVGTRFATEPALRLSVHSNEEAPTSRILHGYDRVPDGARLRYLVQFPSGGVEVEELLRIVRDAKGGRLVREFRVNGVPAGASLVVRSHEKSTLGFSATASTGKIDPITAGRLVAVRLAPEAHGTSVAALRYELPPARTAVAWEGKPRDNPDPEPGSMERPGYRAVAFPRPKLLSGEDRVMPAALAVHPRDGRLFVSSLKTGELFVIKDPRGDVGKATFENYTRGLFQDNYSMLAEDDALYVLHRRNLTRVVDTDADGTADRFERVAALPHGVADTYDYAYGLVRDQTGGFVLSYAPYANTTMPGSGGVLRLLPGQSVRRLALACATHWGGRPGREERSSSPTTRASGSPPTSSAMSTKDGSTASPIPRRSNMPIGRLASPRSGFPTDGRTRSMGSLSIRPGASSVHSPVSSSWRS